MERGCRCVWNLPRELLITIEVRESFFCKSHLQKSGQIIVESHTSKIYFSTNWTQWVKTNKNHDIWRWGKGEYIWEELCSPEWNQNPLYEILRKRTIKNEFQFKNLRKIIGIKKPNNKQINQNPWVLILKFQGLSQHT